MVEQISGLTGTLAAVADPTRRALLEQLCQGPATISELAAPIAMSFAAVSKHVGVLERAGLLRREVRGRAHFCHLQAAPLRAVADWTEAYRRFWDTRLDALARLVESEPPAGGKS